MRRCRWAQSPLMVAYHDSEWGVPVHDGRRLFEFLILEGAQAGLSWEIILRKRENYREAFDRFDPAKVAAYDKRKIRALLADEGIVRNRLKIEAAITNAQAFLAIEKEPGGFDRYVWGFVGGKPKVNRPRSPRFVPVTHERIRRAEQGSEEARLSIRGFDDLLRLHAGRGHGERPHGGLLPFQQETIRMPTGPAASAGQRVSACDPPCCLLTSEHRTAILVDFTFAGHCVRGTGAIRESD